MGFCKLRVLQTIIFIDASKNYIRTHTIPDKT